MDNQNKSYIRSLLTLHNMSIIRLAELMSKELGKTYTRQSLYGKLDRDSLSLKECQIIAKILGYHIEFIKNK
uniref:hypothetical protein n=1 Tax=Candidatus Stercorousia sp. TaxID=3048886 RepID=UPI0040272ACC